MNRPEPRYAPARPSLNLRLYSLLAAAGFFIAMVVIGSIPGKAEALSAATHDKFLHFSAYFILAALLYAGLRGPSGNRIAFTLLAVALMGAADETIQTFLPYRKPEWLDWLFNMWAATLSVFACRTMHRAFEKRRTRTSFDDRLTKNGD